MAVRPQAVVLLSGGLDSATCLYWAMSRGYRPIALSVRYGQRHARELAAARALARAGGVELLEASLALPWLGSSSLVNPRLRLPRRPISRVGRGGIPSTYVPGRNTVFLALAASLADAREAQAVVYGANALDFSGYPDCRPAFARAFTRVLGLGTKTGAEGRSLRVLAPLMGLDKKRIVRLAGRLQVPLELTWSCYGGAARPCGGCDSCQLRAKGFREAGIPDPALRSSERGA